MRDDHYGADDSLPPQDENLAADDAIIADPLADLVEDTPDVEYDRDDGELPADFHVAFPVTAPDAVADPQAATLGSRENRLRALDEAIAVYPDEPANYVLRGEVYLKMRSPGLAALDFEKALEIAHTAVTTRRWGFVNQVVVDRAQRGLRQAARDSFRGKRKRRATGGL